MRELDVHHSNVKQYIVMHDTSADGWQSQLARNSEETIHWIEIQRQYGYLQYSQEDLLLGLLPAVDEFLELHSKWKLEKHFANNHGLTILKGVCLQLASMKLQVELIRPIIQGLMSGSKGCT